MATLPNGVVVPEPGQRISGTGVQEMRTLGASVDSLLAHLHVEVAEGRVHVGPYQPSDPNQIWVDTSDSAPDIGIPDVAGLESRLQAIEDRLPPQ